MLDVVRVSQKGKDQLATLKRRTKIPTNNVLCRWAFCVSLADPSPPRIHISSGENSLEIAWRTFAGEYEDLYYALLLLRCRADGVEMRDGEIARQLRLHIHRGLASMAGDKSMKDIEALVCLIPSPSDAKS